MANLPSMNPPPARSIIVVVTYDADSHALILTPAAGPARVAALALSKAEETIIERALVGMVADTSNPTHTGAAQGFNLGQTVRDVLTAFADKPDAEVK